MLKNKRGFTLIELVIVIVILGILAAVAIPRYVDLATEARDATIRAGLGGLKSAWAISIARYKTEPTVASLAAAIDGGAGAADLSFITISGIFRSEVGRTTELYPYRTFGTVDCTGLPLADNASIVRCISL